MKKVNEIVKEARDTSRFTSLELIHGVFDYFMELHGDRKYGDDPAIVGGIAVLDDQPFTVIATQKGHTVEENIYRNFGSPHPEGYRKAIRLMKEAEKFGRPIVTFVNTPGAYCDVESEHRGIGEAIAESLLVMSDLSVPVLAFFTGEGGSGGALALGMGNKIWMLEYSMYSILSPEGFASILWKDAARSTEAAELMKLTPHDLLELQVIDGIIPETRRKIRREPEDIFEDIKTSILQEAAKMADWETAEIIADRKKRFRNF